MVLCYTDPARHPSLILVEALDLSQVCGRGALHLETLLGMKDSSFWLTFISNWRHIYQCTPSKAIIARASKHNWHKPPSVSMLTPLSVATTRTVKGGFHIALCSVHTSLCRLCTGEGTGTRGLFDLMTCMLRFIWETTSVSLKKKNCLTWSQTNSHFLSLSYWLNSFSLSGGKFMELWKREQKREGLYQF